MKYNLTEESYNIIQSTLNTVDVYHCSDLPLDIVYKEIFGYRSNANLARLRYDWIYGQSGVYSAFINEPRFLDRLNSVISHGDKPYTFRHRVNIINTMLGCNLDSNLPVHISIGLDGRRPTPEVIDISKPDPAMRIIMHPGFTRGIASIFLNSNLKNVMIYVHKDITKSIPVKEYPFLRKVESIEELLPYYRPMNNLEDKEVIYDFKLGGKAQDIDGYRKIHIQNNTPILKVSSIKTVSTPSPKNLHPSYFYVDDTFKSYNDFMNLVVGKKVKIYTDELSSIKYREQDKQKELTDTVFNGETKIRARPNEFRNFKNPYSGIAKDPLSFFLNSVNSFSKREFEIFTEFSKFYSKNIKLLEQEEYEEFYPFNNYEYLEWNSDTSYTDIVVKSQYKGLAIIEKENKLKGRLIEELFFCVNKDAAIIRSTDDNLVIINCEHVFWKETSSFNEIVIPDSFFNVININDEV